MPRVFFTRAAREDLIDIWTHIAEDDPSAADRVLDRLDEVAAHLRSEGYEPVWKDWDPAYDGQVTAAS